METQRVGAAPNNYINNIYFSIPDFTLQKSIHFFRLSVYEKDTPYFFRDFLLPLGFKSVSNKKLDKNNYLMMWTFKNPNDGVFVDVFYSCQYLYLPPMLVKIRNPNKEFVDLLDSFFRYHNIHPNLSCVELTFDFHTDEVIRLIDLLKTHLFMKQQRSASGHKKTTFYTTNIRISVRGMRVYSRPRWNRVRMELVLKS